MSKKIDLNILLEGRVLQKGDFFTVEELEEFFEVERHLVEYNQKFLTLKACLERMYPTFVIRQKDYGLEILTDAKAIDYLNQKVDSAVFNVKKQCTKTEKIESKNLTWEQKDDNVKLRAKANAYRKAIEVARVEIKYANKDKEKQTQTVKQKG